MYTSASTPMNGPTGAPAARAVGRRGQPEPSQRRTYGAEKAPLDERSPVLDDASVFALGGADEATRDDVFATVPEFHHVPLCKKRHVIAAPAPAAGAAEDGLAPHGTADRAPRPPVVAHQGGADGACARALPDASYSLPLPLPTYDFDDDATTTSTLMARAVIDHEMSMKTEFVSTFDVPEQRIVDTTVVDMPPVPDVPNKAFHYSTFIAARLAAFVQHVEFDPDDPAMAAFASEPSVPMDDYIRRIIKLTRLPEEGALAALIYLERIVAAHPGLCITTLNMHRLFLTAAMLASKMMIDIPYQNSFWARVSGTYSPEALNQMELELLPLLDFNLYVSDAEYTRYAEMAMASAKSMLQGLE